MHGKEVFICCYLGRVKRDENGLNIRQRKDV